MTLWRGNMMSRLLATIIILSLLITPLFAEDGDHFNIELLSSLDYWSGIGDVGISGNYAYLVTRYTGIKVVNISDPDNMVEMSCFFYNYNLNHIVIRDNYAYVTDYLRGLIVVDISDPTNLIEIASCNTSEQEDQIKIVGDFAYLLCGSKIVAIDISDPENPFETGCFSNSWFIEDYLINGDFVYMISNQGGLKIIDFSDHSAPSIVGQCSMGGFCYNISMVDNYAYISVNSFQNVTFIKIIDVSDPENPFIANPYNTNIFPREILVIDSYAYVITQYWGFYIMDISDPLNPLPVSSMEFPQISYPSISLFDGKLLIPTGHSLSVIDITDVNIPHVMSTFSRPIGLYNIAISQEHAVIFDVYNRMMVINTTDPIDPYEVSINDIDVYSGFFQNIEEHEDLIYALNSSGELRIYNLDDPVTPEEVGYFDIETTLIDIDIINDYAYLALGGSGFSILNIEDPANPFVIGSCSVEGYSRGVEVSGNYAYIAASESGLRIVDITIPVFPYELTSYEDGYSISSVSVSGNYAYLADGSSGIHVLDISDPENPTEVSLFDTEGYVRKVYADSSILYVADGRNGVRILDISDPYELSEIGFYDTKGEVRDLVVSDNKIYVADSHYFEILDCSEVTSSVDQDISSLISAEFAITSAYPNPFNPTLHVSISLPETADLKVSVFNVMGQEVATLSDGGQYSAGIHNFVFNANDVTSHSSGVYFIHATTPNHLNQIQKVVLMK
jgi:hypothetical protein